MYLMCMDKQKLGHNVLLFYQSASKKGGGVDGKEVSFQAKRISYDQEH